MADTNLPWTFFGRKVRPYCFAVSLACAVVVFGLLYQQDDTGAVLDGTFFGFSIGALALAAVGFLWWGFWARSDRFMRVGLLFSAGLFAGRWIFLSLDGSFDKSHSLLSLCWAIASAGAYLLESIHRGDHGGSK